MREHLLAAAKEPQHPRDWRPQLLAYLITRNDGWEEARLRVLAATYERKSKRSTEELRKTIEEVRIPAEPEVVSGATADSVVKYSADTTLVFMPFRLQNNQMVDPFGNPIEELVTRLPRLVMTLWTLKRSVEELA